MRSQSIPFTVEQRDAAFWAKVDPCRTDGCAVWLGAKTKQGYGNFGIYHGNIRAHHYLIGKPPAKLVTDHLCRNPACVWPEHLEFVTNRENVLRGTLGKAKRAWTHCIHGHPFDEANTRWYRGKRCCRECAKVASRAASRAHHWRDGHTPIRPWAIRYPIL